MLSSSSEEEDDSVMEMMMYDYVWVGVEKAVRRRHPADIVRRYTLSR